MLTASVIIPTHNYGQFIVQAVESVIHQQELEYKVQIIVVDDGSTDDTATRLGNFIVEGLVEYVFIKQAGKALATSLGIKIATGDIIFTLDADDYYLPLKIKTTLNIFERYPLVEHVASPALVVKEGSDGKGTPEKIPPDISGKESKGKKVMEYFLSKKMLFGGGSTFSAKAAFLKQLYLPATIDMYTDEWLVMNAMLAGNTFFYPSALSVWRVHGSNFSVNGFKGEQFYKKQHRLLASSGAVLEAMEKVNMPEKWRHLYRMKDATRKIFFKEITGTKSMKDRMLFFRDFFLSGKYTPATLFYYRALNRLIK